MLDGQVQINGLLLGVGTSYEVTQFQPYTRASRHDQTDRAFSDGAWSGREFTTAAAVPLRVHIVADSEAAWVAAQQQLAAALAASAVDVPLQWRHGGQDYLMFVRPRLVDADPAFSGYGHGPVACALMALDPHIYSAAEHQAVLTLPSTTGGLTYPVSYPISITATYTSGRAQITNAGTATTGLLLRIDAGSATLTDPRVSLITTTAVMVLRFALTLTSGQWLDVDTAARTVYLNGTASRRGATAGDWPLLSAGTAELGFDAAAGDPSAQLRATWRDTW